MSNYPKSKGVFFLNDRKTNEKHPDLRGHLSITAEQIQTLVQMGQAGLEVKLQVAGWHRVSGEGAAYIYIEGEAYFQQPQQQQQPAWPQAAPPMFQQPQQQMPQQQQQQQPQPQQMQQMPQQPQPYPQQQQPQQWVQPQGQQQQPQQWVQPPNANVSATAADFADDDIPF